MSTRRILATAAFASVACGCHHRPPDKLSASAFCAPPAALAPAGIVRIDGWWGPTVNDSLVVIVDGQERWRGLYVPCSSDQATPERIASRPLPADSVGSMYVIRGDSVRRTFHIGGTRPSAMIISTAHQ